MNSIVDKQLALLNRSRNFFDRHFYESCGELTIKAPALNKCVVEHSIKNEPYPVYSAEELEVRKNNLVSDVSAFMAENPEVKYVLVKATALNDYRIEITLHPYKG